MIWLPRTTDISTYFAQSLEIRGIESRLYIECSHWATFLLMTAWMLRYISDEMCHIYMWPVTRKGTSWVSYSEIHFFRFLNREFYDESKNINMLVGSWSFWVSKCPKKMGTALKRHKLSIDVIVTLHVHHIIQHTNTRYKILQKDVTVYLL